MLHLNTISSATHQTLLNLQSKDYIQPFALAGGTNLSLRYGHRTSIDLDLFSCELFEPTQLTDVLQIEFDYVYRSNNKYMLFGYINDIKVDFVHHPFKLLYPPETIDSIRLFSVDDVSAMKLFAVTKRGSRKDFYDIFQLSQALGPHKLIESFSNKYGEDKIWMMQISLIYFDDADQEEDPELFIPGLNWESKKIYEANIF